MKLNALFLGLAFLAAPALSNTFEQDVVAKAGNLRRLDKVDDTKVEIEKLDAEIAEWKEKKEAQKAECKPLDKEINAAKKAYKDAEKEYNGEVDECKKFNKGKTPYDKAVDEKEAELKAFNQGKTEYDEEIEKLEALYKEANKLVQQTRGEEKEEHKATRDAIKKDMDEARKDKNEAKKMATKARNEARNGWNAAFAACRKDRDEAKKTRNQLKSAFDSAKRDAKRCAKDLKKVIRELRKRQKRKNNKKKKLQKLKKRKKNANKRKRKKKSKTQVKKELVAGQCVADHVCAAIRGDPHITTFDGLKYDCQGEGEFVLAKAINTDTAFEVQGRFKSIGKSKMVSITTAVSIDTGVEGEPDVDVFTEMVDGSCALYYFVEGVPTNFSTPVPGISYEGNSQRPEGSDATDYLFFTGSGVMYSVYAKNGKFGCVLNSKLCLPPSMVQQLDIVGLLGTPDGIKSNEWTTPSGAELSQSNTGKAAAYAMCTKNWCVRKAEDSIFGYLEGTKHADFENCDLPYDASADEILLDPPEECVACCEEHPMEEQYDECIEECSMAEEGERVEQCVIDIEDAVLLQDVEKKCKDPVIPDPDERTAPPVICDYIHLDMKCADGSGRVLDDRDSDLASCHTACEKNPECEFYSFMEEGEHAGTCLGCKAEEDATSHAGFNFYPVDCNADEADKEPEPGVECKDMRINVKCPYKHEDRLYRLEGQTLESCQKVCEETEGCDYYSFGHEDAAQYQGVCMGCTSDVNKEAHTGFNLYSVDCIGVFDKTNACPTDTKTCADGSVLSRDPALDCEFKDCPPAPPVICDYMHLDMKCAQGSGRVLDDRDSDLASCHTACEEHLECEFYSFAEEGEHAGTCLGCKSDEDATSHTDFNFYPVDCNASDSDKEPEPSVECKDMRINVKCPYKHEDRLYRLEGQTLESCQKECEETEGCDYYSFGHEGAAQYQGVCMGCNSDVNKEAHTGFNLYSVDCIGEKEKPGDKTDACPADTKTCPDGTVLSRVGSDCEFKDCPTPDDEPEETTTDRAYTKGDPHFKTFGGEFYDFHGECDLVLLNNPEFKSSLGMTIHIRTKITDWWSSVQAAAIKIGDDTLEIDGGNLDKWLYVNGVENEDMVDGKWYRANIAGFLVRYKKAGAGREAYIYLEGAKEFLILKAFKDFVRVDVDWKESDNYHGATGLLGSYELNGNRVGRDGVTHIANHNEFGMEWQVQADEPQLFHTYEGAVLPPNKCILPEDGETATKQKLRKRRLAESNLTMEAIEQACAHLATDVERKGCEYDIIATQDISMAGAW